MANKKNCFEPKRNCTTFTLSTCVDWTGKELTSFSNDEVLCNLSITNIIEKIDEKLKYVIDSIDVKDLTDCNTSDFKLKDILNIYLNTIFELKSKIDKLEKVNSITLTNEVTFNIDTSCLTNSNACYLTSKTIEDLFKILYTEVCYLKNKIE